MLTMWLCCAEWVLIVHCPNKRRALVSVFTLAFVFAPAYLPAGPLTFNVIP